MSKNTNLMSKNIVTKPVAINSIEVWMSSKGNFLRKWFWCLHLQDSAMLVKQISCEQTWEVS